MRNQWKVSRVITGRFGAKYSGVYTLSLVRLGQTYTGAALVAGNTAFGAMWGLGGIIGPAVVGSAMTAVGPLGFPLVLTLAFTSVAAAVALVARTIQDNACELYSAHAVETLSRQRSRRWG